MSRKDQLNALFGMKPAALNTDARAPETKSADGQPPAPASDANLLGAPNSADQAAANQQVSAANLERARAGAVGALGASLRHLTEAERLVELDPALIDPAPVGDRIAGGDDADFVALKTSIAESGQQVPVLVRLHPATPGRYQAAYGHRRIRAARELGVKVRAEIKPLSDEALAIAQGQENLARRDLSFIEKALFAAGLERAGLSRPAILRVLATDKGDVSRYIAVANAVPETLVRAIGPAPKTGRARWLALSEALAAAGWRPGKALPGRVNALFEKISFDKADSDGRFALALAAISPKLPRAKEFDVIAREVRDGQGRRFAALEMAGGQARLTFAPEDAGFASFLADELPELHRRWREVSGG